MRRIVRLFRELNVRIRAYNPGSTLCDIALDKLRQNDRTTALLILESLRLGLEIGISRSLLNESLLYQAIRDIIGAIKELPKQSA